MRSRTVTTILPAPAREVFAYMSEIENLPEWATEFARELHHDEAGYRVVNNLGEFRFEIRADERTGVIDMFAGPTTEEMAVFPTRAVELAERTHGLLVHDVPGSRDARRPVRRSVRVAEARIRQHRGTVRVPAQHRVSVNVRPALPLMPKQQRG